MKVRRLSKTYETHGGSVKALSEVSFDLPEKGAIFILGKSGSGKSTLLHVLGGLDGADKGSEIEACGRKISECGEKELGEYRNGVCGFVFQEYNLIPELNVRENIKLSLELQGKKDNDKAVEEALNKVGLGGYGERKITELSGGQKQRVAIARAIVKQPKIVFADEPTGALDEQTGESIFELLKEISQDRLVIAVTHDRSCAEKYGDRVIELSDGKIASDSDGGYISSEEQKGEPIKTKLPLKSAAKIGLANFKFHPIRLIATLILSVFAFSFLGIALAAAFNKYENIVYNAMIEDGVIYSALFKDGGTERITQREKTEIERSLGQAVFGVEFADGSVELSVQADNMYDGVLPTVFAELTEETAKKLRFDISGRLPTSSGELCITAFSADIINRLEFDKPSLSGLIGENLTVGGERYTVVGIVDTRFDSSAFDALKKTTEANELFKAYATTLGSSVHNLMFASALGDEYDALIVKNSRGAAKYIDGERFIINNYTVERAGAYKAVLSRIKTGSIVLAAVFSAFAAILMLNFLMLSFTDKLFSLGILKANGCGRSGLFKVFVCEAAVIAAVVFCVSCAVTVTACVCFNARFGVAFFGMFEAVIPIMACAVAAVAVAACVMPFFGVMRMTPIDVISKSA